MASFDGAPRLFGTRRLVDDFNMRQLQQGTSKHPIENHDDGEQAAVARIPASDFGRATGANDGGLLAVLFVKVGARVMLRMNLCTRLGLVNGAVGTVVEIIYPPGGRPPDPPHCILVQFDDYSGESCLPNAERVVPVFRRRCFGQEGGDSTRLQFPLTLAWAMTIHKCVNFICFLGYCDGIACVW